MLHCDSLILFNQGPPVPSDQLRNHTMNVAPVVGKHYLAHGFLLLHLIRTSREQSAGVDGDR